jgi:hypothetical protein
MSLSGWICEGLNPSNFEENWQVSHILATASCAPCVECLSLSHLQLGFWFWNLEDFAEEGKKPFPSSATDEFFCGRNWSYVLLLSFQQRIVSLMWRFWTKPAVSNWWWWWWWTGWIQQTIWSASILRRQGDFVSSFCAKMVVTQFWGRKHESANNQCRWFHTQVKQLVRVQGCYWGKWWVRARLTDTQHQWILRFISGYE